MTSDTQSSMPPPEVRERVRGYLVAQAERRDWLELWPRVTGSRAKLLETLAEVSEAQAAWKPAPNEWSVQETAQHILQSSRGTLAIIEALARGHAPTSAETGAVEAPPQASPEPAGSYGDLRRAFAEHSVRVTSLIERLPAEVDYQATAPHRFFGELNCRAWFLFLRIHDDDHLGQITKVREAPGFPQE